MFGDVFRHKERIRPVFVVDTKRSASREGSQRPISRAAYRPYLIILLPEALRSYAGPCVMDKTQDRSLLKCAEEKTLER